MRPDHSKLIKAVVHRSKVSFEATWSNGKTDAKLTGTNEQGIYGYTDQYTFFCPWHQLISFDFTQN